MKKLKKKTFFIVGFCILIISVLTTSICLLESQEKSEALKVESEISSSTNGNLDNENCPSDDDEIKEDPEDEIFELPEIYIDEGTINLADNGIGYEILIEEKGQTEFYFDVEGIIDILYEENQLVITPLSIGETRLTIRIKTDKEIIYKSYKVIISQIDESLSFNISGIVAGQPLKSLCRADGTYEIYTVTVNSCRNLTNEDFLIEKSDNICIVENSYSIEKLENNGTKITFSFYVLEGKQAFLKAEIINSFLNCSENVFVEKNFEVVEFIQKIEYEIKAYNNYQPNIEENCYLLYLPNYDCELKMNEGKYFTYYILKIDKDLYDVELSSGELTLKESENGYIISSCCEGYSEINIYATDGSNQIEKLLFKSINAPEVEFDLSVNGEGKTYSFEELYNYLLNLKNFDILLEDQSLIIKTVISPSFYENEFDIIKAEGNSVILEKQEFEAGIITQFNFVEIGETTFSIYYNDDKISNFTINVKIVEQEQPEDEIENIQEISVNKDYLYLDINSLFGENVSRVGYKIYCEQEGITFDPLSYNGFAYIKFDKIGNYLLTIENIENGIKISIKLKVE